MHSDCPELERFVRGEIERSAFPHREHVRMAFEMLRRHAFRRDRVAFLADPAGDGRAGKPRHQPASGPVDI